MKAAVVIAIAIFASSSTPQPPWKGLPTRTTAPHNAPGDPVNIAFEGSQSAILRAFDKIGWVKADPLSLKNDLHLAEAALHHGKYPKAPVSNLFLFNRKEDFAVEKELGSVSSRDHARFWDTSRKDPVTQKELWIGACSRDIAIKILKTKHGRPKGTTHKIDGNLDDERALVVNAVKGVGLVQAVIMEPGVGRMINGRNGGGDVIKTDGQAAVIVLK